MPIIHAFYELHLFFVLFYDLLRYLGSCFCLARFSQQVLRCVEGFYLVLAQFLCEHSLLEQLNLSLLLSDFKKLTFWHGAYWGLWAIRSAWDLRPCITSIAFRAFAHGATIAWCRRYSSKINGVWGCFLSGNITCFQAPGPDLIISFYSS
jgi:hypothetical protein